MMTIIIMPRMRLRLWNATTILQVIYEHVEPWCNDIDRVKLPIRPPELSGNPTKRLI
jgi:hypothetical protein